MVEGIHTAAPHSLPPFITAPGETDALFVFIAVFLISIVLLVGNFYFKLHALPESMAHRTNSTQFQLVGVLSLLALFTHNNIFWIGALLIAALRMPDFSTPLTSIARSLSDLSERLDREPALSATAASEDPVPPPAPAPLPAAAAQPATGASMKPEVTAESDPPAAPQESTDSSNPDEPKG